MNSGIYQIYNTVTDRSYVGSSCDLKHRLGFHKTALKNGKHPNNYLQSAFAKYGMDSFVVRILEPVSKKDDLLAREQYWMDLSKAEEGHLYNLNPFTTSGIGHIVPLRSRKIISEKLKAKGIRPPSRQNIGYGFCKLYCPKKHYKTSKSLIHGSNACKECQRIKSIKWRSEH